MSTRRKSSLWAQPRAPSQLRCCRAAPFCLCRASCFGLWPNEVSERKREHGAGRGGARTQHQDRLLHSPLHGALQSALLRRGCEREIITQEGTTLRVDHCPGGQGVV